MSKSIGDFWLLSLSNNRRFLAFLTSS
jgi:hypothetical protein